jgi:hypothetical protein
MGAAPKASRIMTDFRSAATVPPRGVGARGTSPSLPRQNGGRECAEHPPLRRAVLLLWSATFEACGVGYSDG